MFTRVLFLLLACVVSARLVSAQVTPGSGTVGSDYRFGRLGGVATDGSGSLFVTEIDGSRFTRFTSSLDPVYSIRQSLSGSYDLKNPGNPCVRTNGQILIPDIGSDKVLLFDSLGQFLSSLDGTPFKGLADPSQVAEDSSGAIYVADKNNHRIIKYNADRNLAWEVGTYGTAQGQFRFPSGIAVTPSNRVVVSDEQNNRLQVFTVDGSFVQQIDTSATGIGVTKPGSITSVSDGSIWVVSKGTGKVFQIDLTGQILATIDYSSVAPVKPNPVSVAVNGNRVLVADGENCQIYRFSLDGTYQDKVLSGLDDTSRLNLPHNAIVHNNEYVVADSGSHRISFYGIDGKYLRSFGSFGDGTGLFQHPSSVAANSEGLLAIADTGNRRIQITQQDGTTVRSISGGVDFTLSYPTQAIWGDNGSLWIVDQNNSCVRYFDGTGNFVRTIGGRGSSIGKFDSPFALAVAPNGDILVSDTHNHRIQRFSPDGTFISSVGSLGSGPGQFNEPKGIIVFNQGLYAVADSGNHRIQIFRLDGTFVTAYGSFGDKNGEFISPEHLSAAGTNQIVVTDSSTHKVTSFTSGIDLTPPTSTIVVDPNVGANWSNRSVQVFISATDMESGVREVHYSINGGIEQIVFTSNASFTLSETGTYELAYWAVDNANNIEATKYATVRIDKTPPTIDGYVVSGKLTLMASDGRSGVAAIKYSLDGATVVTYTSPLTIPAGAHTYTFYSVDNAGNESVKETILVGATVSVTLLPTSVYASKSSVATIKLSVAAPVGGVTVMLASSNPAVTIAPSVKLNAGATSINVPVQTGAVAADTSAVITATVGGIESYATLVVMVPYPKTLVISPNVITGGNTATGTVSLQSAAPAGGQLVTLTSMHPDVTVPSTVTVLAGALSANFTVTTKVASKDYSAAIYAEADDAGIGTTVLVKRVTPKSVTFAPSSIVGGNTSVGTVTLNVAAPTGGATVMLKSTSSLVTLPTSVTFAEGQTTATFDISTSITPRTILASIQAAAAGVKVSGVLTVSGLNVLSVTLAPNSVLGGTSTTGSVNLNTNAPAGGVTVQLYTTSSIAGVPVSVTVPAGQKTGTFTVTTSPVSANALVQVVGKFLGVAKPATLTVQAAAVSTVTLNPTSVKGGTNSTLTIKLTGLAGPSGLVVTLTSSNLNAATVPATVTVAAGTDTVDVVVTTKVVTANTTSTLTAKTAASSKTVVLTVTK